MAPSSPSTMRVRPRTSFSTASRPRNSRSCSLGPAGRCRHGSRVCCRRLWGGSARWASRASDADPTQNTDTKGLYLQLWNAFPSVCPPFRHGSRRMGSVLHGPMDHGRERILPRLRPVVSVSDSPAATIASCGCLSPAWSSSATTARIVPPIVPRAPAPGCLPGLPTLGSSLSVF